MNVEGAQGGELPGGGAPEPIEPGADPMDANQPAPVVETPELPPEVTALINAAVTSALDAHSEKTDPRLRELELDNARLKALAESGGAGQPMEPEMLATDGEYRYLSGSLQYRAQAAQAAGNEEEVIRAQQGLDQLRDNYAHFQRKQEVEREGRQTRSFERARFFADHQIAQDSDMGRYVEALHEQGTPLNKLNENILSPIAEAQRLRGQQAGTAATGAAISAATQIEPGQQRTDPPAPISKSDLTPEQADEEALVEHYQAHTGGSAVEKALFGEF